jgi:hypothetical protein
MAIRADHAGHGVADRHAIAHLRDRGIVVPPEDLERAVLILRRLRLDRDVGGNGFRFARQMLLARGVAERAHVGIGRCPGRSIFASGSSPASMAKALARS